jgi:hypothetical protein
VASAGVMEVIMTKANIKNYNMRKIILALTCTIYLMSCNNENSGSGEKPGGEAGAEEVPKAIDTTKHPTGINEGAVISTDTAAYNVENTNPDGREKLDKDKKE